MLSSNVPKFEAALAELQAWRARLEADLSRHFEPSPVGCKWPRIPHRRCVTVRVEIDGVWHEIERTGRKVKRWHLTAHQDGWRWGTPLSTSDFDRSSGWEAGLNERRGEYLRRVAASLNTQTAQGPKEDP